MKVAYIELFEDELEEAFEMSRLTNLIPRT